MEIKSGRNEMLHREVPFPLLSGRLVSDIRWGHSFNSSPWFLSFQVHHSKI